MKLYTTAASPFGARVKIQVYKKKLPVEILAPPGGLGSSEMLDITPMNKIPVLEAGDATIVESEIIQEYLQEKFPQPSMLGDTPESAAIIRTLSRLADLYLVPALQPFRSYLKGEIEDRKIMQEGIAGLQKVFCLVDHFMDAGSYAVGNRLSLADCCMAPLFNYILHFSRVLDVELSLPSCKNLDNWLANIRHDESVDRVLEEIETNR